MNTRELILKNSQELFFKKGYEATSMADIIKSCQISKGAVYHYFSSKEQIMRDVIQNMIDIQIDEITFILNKDKVTGYQKLVEILEFCVKRPIKEKIKVSQNEDSIFYYNARKQSKESTIIVLENLIKQGTEDTSIKKCESKFIAQNIYSLMDVLIENSSLKQDITGQYELLIKYLEMVLIDSNEGA